MILTSDGKKIIGYSKGTNAANSGFMGTNDTIGVLEGTNACEVAFNGRNLNTFTFVKPTNAAFNTLVQSHVVYTDRIDPADGPTHPYKCTCFNNSNSTLYTRNTPGNFYINSNISYMIRGNSAVKMNALSIFTPGTLNNVTNVYRAFNNALMFDWNWDTDNCDNISYMFDHCNFNNSNIIFNTVNGGIDLLGSCTHVGTCRVKQNGGANLPGIYNSSINVVDFNCNVNGGSTRFSFINANVFNLNANISNYTLSGALFLHSSFVASSINLSFNNSAVYQVVLNAINVNANINGATVNYIGERTRGSFNITNSVAKNGAFINSTGAINANLSNCTISGTVLNGSINNSRIALNACTHPAVITGFNVNNVIINEYNSTVSAPQISNCTATNTKCYWNKCNSYGFYGVDGSTEQHWENSIVQYSIDYSKNSAHNVFFNNVYFAGNAIRNINNCKVNCNIIGSNSSTYSVLFNCNNSVVNLNQNGNAGYPASFCNNLNLNYRFTGTSGATRTSPIQYVYNSNIFAVCQLNNCNHTNVFATECKDTKITLYDYNKNDSLLRRVLTNSSNINFQYYSATLGKMFGVNNSVISGNLILNDCNNISGTITTNYGKLNLYNVDNSNIVLSPGGVSSSYITMQYCNNVKINYTLFYNMPPVNYNTCSNMFLTTTSGNSVLFAPNNKRWDLDSVSLHSKMIASNRCVALQAPNIFVQTITTPGTNTNTGQYNLTNDLLIGGTAAMNASYMAGHYNVMATSNNVRCIGMINYLMFSNIMTGGTVNSSVIRTNVTYGVAPTLIKNSYYATNNVYSPSAITMQISDSVFIANDTSYMKSSGATYINNSVCVLGGQSTKWNTNRNIQFDNCLVIAVKWNRSTYGNIKFNNSVLVSSTAFGTLVNNSTRVTSLAHANVNAKYNTCMPSMFKMPIEGFKMLTGVADAPDSSVISI